VIVFATCVVEFELYIFVNIEVNQTRRGFIMSKHLLLYLFSFFFGLLSLVESQTMWTKYPGNPVLSGGDPGKWNRHIFGPEVIFNEDSARFEMWFTGSYGPPTWRPYQIGYATSSDGISWTPHDSSVMVCDPGTWEASTVEFPSVIKEVDTLKMWYTGWSAVVPRSIGYATSTDGITWIKDTLNNPVMGPGTEPWEAGGNFFCEVMKDFDTLKMWYTGRDVAGTSWQIGYATSLDGITWDRYGPPVIPSGSPGEWDDEYIAVDDVIKMGNIYYLFYTSIESGLYQIGLATSTNGYEWQKYDDPTTTNPPFAESDPVLKPSPGQWDGSYVESASVMLKDEVLHLWYDGSRTPVSTYLWRIGYATAPVTYHVPTFVSTIQGAIDASNDGNIVLVEEGTYQENINFKGKAITVASRFLMDGDTSHISNTIIDGSEPSHPDTGSVVRFVSGEDTNSVLKGFTITGGIGTVHSTFNYRGGGGIYCFNSGGCIESNHVLNNTVNSTDEATGGGLAVDVTTPTTVIIRDNRIINNSLNGTTGAYGAGVEIVNVNAKVIGNEISHNHAVSSSGQANPGGLGFWSDTPSIPYAVVKDNQISFNSATGIDVGNYSGAGSGGLGIYEYRGVVENNKITHNWVNGSQDAFGAGMSCGDIPDSLVIVGNYIANNSVEHGYGWGGGLCIYRSGNIYSPVIVLKNIIVNNSAEGGSGSVGGGIWIRGNSEVIMLNNSVLFNLAESGGGLNSRNSNTTIVNSIFWQDSSIVGHPELVNSGTSGSLEVSYSDVKTGWSGFGNINTDPFLYDSVMTTSDTTYCCMPQSSPCVDAGINHPLCNDPEDPLNPGFALWPAMGTLRNDMGAHGGVSENLILFSKILGIDLISKSVPTSYIMYQNYPNPFNPATTIEFDLPKTTEVSLKVFNILGEEVATLVSDRLSAGSYSYEWNASNLASGVYLYRLQAGDYVETRKMVLMR
jgi:predicted GH43/DUF377 family glycosyl hydrolase